MKIEFELDDHIYNLLIDKVGGHEEIVEFVRMMLSGFLVGSMLDPKNVQELLRGDDIEVKRRIVEEINAKLMEE